VAVVGAATLLLAGFSALVQNDIKRVLAYSTISQIGYMFLALGVGAWSAAMFHFMTHAFFKALLFLGAGAVIEAMHHEQNIFKMGGLRCVSGALLPSWASPWHAWSCSVGDRTLANKLWHPVAPGRLLSSSGCNAWGFDWLVRAALRATPICS
jgi:formate hydrogenlyase subunit 3/multisubunit Na+/H+ antiporter MnhD subunit